MPMTPSDDNLVPACLKILLTKPRTGRPYNGQEMQTRDIALRHHIRSIYQDRGSWEGLIPRSIETWPVPLAGDAATAELEGEYCASLETKLYGSALRRLPVFNTTAEDLVTFLSVMKEVEVEGLEKRLGVRIPEMFFPDLEVLRVSAIEAWGRMVKLGQISAQDILLKVFDQDGFRIENTSKLEYFLTNQTACIRNIQNPNQTTIFSLVHDDLKSEHILIDESSGRITAILDWADAGRGNAAVHVSGLALTVGKRMAVMAAERAGYDEDTILQGLCKFGVSVL